MFQCKQFLDVIRGEVVVGKESESSFRYLGLQPNQKCDFIEFDQTQYVNSLEFLKDGDRITDKRFRGKAGQLM